VLSVSRRAHPRRASPLSAAVFVLTDLCGFSPDEAVERTARIAQTVTAAAIRGVAAE